MNSQNHRINAANKRQHGIALLILVIAIALSAVTYVFSQLSIEQVQLEQKSQTVFLPLLLIAAPSRTRSTISAR